MTALVQSVAINRVRLDAQTSSRHEPYAAPSVRKILQPEEPDRFESLRRYSLGVGQTSVHPNAVIALIGVYAVLMLVFWMAFADAETALTLGVITMLATLYFGLLGGGILLSDSLPNGLRGRSFGNFLNGQTLAGTGWISGREAFAQIIILPVCLAVGAGVFGLIWRFTAG